jgi:hypothetical protein
LLSHLFDRRTTFQALAPHTPIDGSENQVVRSGVGAGDGPD